MERLTPLHQLQLVPEESRELHYGVHRGHQTPNTEDDYAPEG